MSEGNTLIKNDKLYIGDIVPANSYIYPSPINPTPIYPNTLPAPYIAPSYDWYQTTTIPSVPTEVFKALNGVVLCEPFKTNTVKKKERSGFATIDQKVTLTALTVMVGNGEIGAGTTVYVRAEACQQGWGKEVFESEGQHPFIRVPVTEIVYIKQILNTSGWTLGSGYKLDCASNK